MKLRISIGTAVAAAAGVLALTAGSAVAAAPVAHTAATASTKTAARVATHLTLKTSTVRATAGSTITLTAHLDKHGTNRTVVIYGQSWTHGSKPFVVGKGAVDKHGNLTVKYHTYQNHTFYATFSGGTTYAPSKSGLHVVRTPAKVTAGLGGYYTSTKWAGHTVRVFHKTTSIFIKGAVSPDKGSAIITIQAYYQGKWYAGDTETIKLAANGKYNVNTGKDSATGDIFRVLVSTKADSTNPAGSSGWLYLKSSK